MTSSAASFATIIIIQVKHVFVWLYYFHQCGVSGLPSDKTVVFTLNTYSSCFHDASLFKWNKLYIKTALVFIYRPSLLLC